MKYTHRLWIPDQIGESLGDLGYEVEDQDKDHNDWTHHPPCGLPEYVGLVADHKLNVLVKSDGPQEEHRTTGAITITLTNRKCCILLITCTGYLNTKVRILCFILTGNMLPIAALKYHASLTHPFYWFKSHFRHRLTCLFHKCRQRQSFHRIQ